MVFYVGYGIWLARIYQSPSGSAAPSGAAATLMVIGAVLMLAAIGWNIYNRWIIAGRTGQSHGQAGHQDQIDR